LSIDWASLWRKEDWWAVWLGFLILAVASTRLVTWLPNVHKWTVDLSIAVNVGEIPYFILLGFCLLMLTSMAILAMKEKIKRYWIGFPLVFFLAFLAHLLANQKAVKEWGVGYALWALIIGLLISNTVGTPKRLKPAIKTELFIKIGLVLLGAEILFSVILVAGALGLFEVTVGLALVWYLCYYLAIKLGLRKSFAAIMANATSVCGVSAAIAAGGAVKGDPKEISYTISLVLLFAGPMMVLLPLISQVIGLSEVVAGAWIGGTIDTTPAVVAAGAIYGDKAMAIASVVKMSQNILIGVTAFLLALYWVVRVERKSREKPKAIEIWYRFPKFIVGFIIASTIFSLLLVPTMGAEPVSAILKITKGLRGWFFALAFVSIGLDTRFTELVKIGRGKPFIIFITATIWDVAISLISAYVFFGGLLFPLPSSLE
jgi:uncharacterized membrane protein YadS